MSADPHVLRFLLERRSAGDLDFPGPSAEQLATLIQAAATAPDHGSHMPYRFVVVQGEGRDAFGEALAAAAAEARPDVPAEAFAKVKKKAFKAPACVVVICSPKLGGKAELWEQQATAACAGFAIVLAATALGLGAVWKSTPHVAGRRLAEVLGLTDGEQVLGWINVGTLTSGEGPRRPTDVTALASVLGANGRTPLGG